MQLSSMRLHDLERDGEVQTCTNVFCRERGIERVVASLLGQAWPVIPHLDHCKVIALRRRYLDFAGRICVASSRMNGILKKVIEHLQHFASIADHVYD